MLFKLPTKEENALFQNLPVRNSDLAVAMGNGNQYWLADYVPRSIQVYVVDGDMQDTVLERFDDEYIGVRPMIPAREAQKIKANSKRVFTYGEYPQKKVTDTALYEQLDNALYQHNLNSTGKEYTLPFGHHQSKCGEYEYNGKKYVKVTDLDCWFEVNPIEWIKSTKSGDYISQSILFASMWNDCSPTSSKFDPSNTSMKRFLRDVFAKEIMPQNAQIQVQQLFPNQNVSGQQAVNNVINQTLTLPPVKFTIPNNDDLYLGDYVVAVGAKCTEFSSIKNSGSAEYGYFWVDMPHNEPCVVKSEDEIIYSGGRDIFDGVRPMISSNEAQKIKGFLRKVGETRIGKLNIYELGEFPQDKVSGYIDVKKMHPTGKVYHTGYDVSGKNCQADEYELNKTKYAAYNNSYYLVKPIRWIESKDGRLLAENILLTSKWGDGENPDVIINGLNTYFAKEIVPQGNNMQNQNIYPQIINQREFGDGVTVSDIALPDIDLPDAQGEDNGWFQVTAQPQTHSAGASSANGRQIPVSGGQPRPVAADTNREEIEEIVTELDRNQNQKGAKKMNNNSNSMVVVDETPMSVNEQIEFYVKNGMSFMLHGPSGIGKTARVEQVDPDLTAVPLWNGVLPEDIVGKVRYPSGQEVTATEENLANGVWVEPDWYVELKRKCEAEPEKMHVLFIDEVTNARPTTQSLIFHLTLKKSITPSKGKLPENSVVVLAGNNRDESEAAYNMPEPLFRRMSGHIYLEPNVREWMVWGSENSYKHPEDKGRTNIHPLVSSFVGTYGDDVFYSEYNEEESKYALDPRGWEQISDIIYDNHGVIRKELLVAKMGNVLASNFLAFAKIPQLSVEDVVSHNYDARSLPQSQDARLALTLNLRHADDKQQTEVRRFIIENLGKEYGSVFDAARASSELAAKNKAMAFKLGGWGRNG